MDAQPNSASNRDAYHELSCYTLTLLVAQLFLQVLARVEVLARHEGRPVQARQGTVTVASFHPELSGDLRLHELFLQGV